MGYSNDKAYCEHDPSSFGYDNETNCSEHVVDAFLDSEDI